MPKNDSALHIEVAYVNDGRSYLVPLELPGVMTIAEVIDQSGILQSCPEIDLEENRVGIYSKLRNLDDLVADGDRIEIYRALLANPRDSRRRRAALEKNKSSRADKEAEKRENAKEG